MTEPKKHTDKRNIKTITTEVTFSLGIPGFIELEVSRTYEWEKPKHEKPSIS